MKSDDLTALISAKGARIPQPATVFIDPEINPENIATDITIHPGCRITGVRTSIGPGCQLGAEAPVTIKDCQLGAGVELHGGFFHDAVILDRAQFGSGAHIRPGTLIEEESGGAHTVGLKQTVLLPYVTLGSLINFCDCLMAGGTSRKNHSEVGSSYIHFNYTPHQDKATPSLLGDVPRGVLLDQPPIFMGGQGGLVGPARVAYGVIVPAGQIVRQDVAEPGLYMPSESTTSSTGYQAGCYRSIRRILANNINYIGNIMALRAWYENVRSLFMQNHPYQKACREGAIHCLNAIIQERLRRLDELADKMPRSLSLHGVNNSADLQDQPALQMQKNFHAQWPQMRAELMQIAARPWNPPAVLKQELQQNTGKDYLEAIKALSPAAAEAARNELAKIVAMATDTLEIKAWFKKRVTDGSPKVRPP